MSSPIGSPPQELREDLELDPRHWSSKEIYRLQTALIAPRPIAWVSTLSLQGADNLAPHSYFNGVSDDPPMVMFCIEGESDTYRNLQEIPEFVVNLVTLDLAERMEITAVTIPYDESEFEWSGLRKGCSSQVQPRRVAEAKACLECKVERILDVGTRNHMVIGEVVHFFVDHRVWRNGRVDPKVFQPLARLGGRYAALGDVFKMPRPSWDDVKNTEKAHTAALVRKMFDR